MLNLLLAANASIDTIMPTLVTFLNIIFFISFTDGKPLLPAYTVFSIGFYIRLCYTMGFYFTRAMIYFTGYRVSTKRIAQFLLTNELDRSQILTPSDSQTAIELNDFNFSFDKTDVGFSLRNINLRVKKGEFVSIVGAIGSGKVNFFFTYKFVSINLLYF